MWTQSATAWVSLTPGIMKISLLGRALSLVHATSLPCVCIAPAPITTGTKTVTVGAQGKKNPAQWGSEAYACTHLRGNLGLQRELLHQRIRPDFSSFSFLYSTWLHHKQQGKGKKRVGWGACKTSTVHARKVQSSLLMTHPVWKKWSQWGTHFVIRY